MKRPIEFGYVGSLSFNTKWIDSGSIDDLKEKVKTLKDPFMKLVSTIDHEYKGLRVKYYEVDADDFGTGDTSDEVSKWLVEFIPLEEDKFEEIIVDDSE
jgi:hypothetical protein